MRKSIKLASGLAAGLLVMSLSSAPARAHHAADVIAPAAAFVALGWMLHQGHHGHHGHHRHYHYYKQHRYHGSYGHKKHYGSHYKQHRRHSHSKGGYQKKRRHIRH